MALRVVAGFLAFEPERAIEPFDVETLLLGFFELATRELAGFALLCDALFLFELFAVV